MNRRDKAALAFAALICVAWWSFLGYCAWYVWTLAKG